MQDNRGFQTLKQELDEFEYLSVLGIMSTSKKTLVNELLGSKWNQSFGPFYVMSAILKIVNEVLHRINERESLNINQVCMEKHIPELEERIR